MTQSSSPSSEKVATSDHNKITQTKASLTKRRFLLYVVPCLLVIVLIVFYLFSGRYVETDNAYIKADKTPLKSEVAGKVVEVNVEDNQQVKAGDVLFKIDPKSYLIALEQAKSNLLDVKTNLLTLKDAYKSKLTEIKLLKSEYAYHKKEEMRQLKMREKNYLSAADYDKAHQSTQIDLLTLETLQAGLGKIKTSLGGDINIPLEQHPKYLAAKAALAQAKLNLKHTVIKAPTSGVVTTTVKKGQLMAPGSLATTLIADHDLWIEANYTEIQLAHVQVGQDVEIQVDSAPDYTWQGKVESLSPATGSEFSVIPAENATGNWVKITQRLPIKIQILAQENAPQLRAGLSTTVSIDTKYHRRLFGFTL